MNARGGRCAGRWPAALLLAALLLGCPGDDDDLADDDVSWPENFSGQLEIHSTHDGEVACDVLIELAGTRYTGICEECDFAFAIDATVTFDAGTGVCELDPRWSYLAADPWSNLLLAHAPVFQTHGWYGTYTFSDALLTGYTLADADEDPLWWLLAHGDSADASFDRVGDELSWSYGAQGPLDVDPHYDDCGGIVESDATEALGGTVVAMSELPCDGSRADAWTFAGVAGEGVSITVDTIAADTAFDPRLYVNAPDGCTVRTADDNFDCTFPPPSYRCPAVSLDGSDGEYEVVVLAAGSCAGAVGGYSIRVDGPAGASLELAEDDLPVVVELDLQVTGSGTLGP
jgi:hypothetical protein